LSSTSLQLLFQAPELAVLEVLEATIAATCLALRAAHPELGDEDFAAAPHPPSLQSSMADAILTHLPPLRQSLRRYRTLLVTQQLWAGYTPASEDPGF
jgi:hypothetical protein